MIKKQKHCKVYLKMMGEGGGESPNLEGCMEPARRQEETSTKGRGLWDKKNDERGWVHPSHMSRLREDRQKLSRGWGKVVFPVRTPRGKKKKNRLQGVGQ